MPGMVTQWTKYLQIINKLFQCEEWLISWVKVKQRNCQIQKEAHRSSSSEAAAVLNGCQWKRKKQANHQQHLHNLTEKTCKHCWSSPTATGSFSLNEQTHTQRQAMRLAVRAQGLFAPIPDLVIPWSLIGLEEERAQPATWLAVVPVMPLSRCASCRDQVLFLSPHPHPHHTHTHTLITANILRSGGKGIQFGSMRKIGKRGRLK